jgi:hypothetical protein
MSSTCHEDTFLQWFILSLSDLIIADGEGKGRLPSSGFSRYAAIYSLRPYDLYLDYSTCLPRVKYREIKKSRETQGNWVCIRDDLMDPNITQFQHSFMDQRPRSNLPHHIKVVERNPTTSKATSNTNTNSNPKSKRGPRANARPS